MHWELYLDDRPIDLASFGTVDVIHPRKGLDGQSEVFAIDRAWNVMIAQASGQHVLRSVLRLDQGSNSSRALQWTIRFATSE